MKGILVVNEFYVSKFLMQDVDLDKYDVVFENDFRSRIISKTLARFKSFILSPPGSCEHVLAFAIENIIILDQIYRQIGKPKVWLWNPISSMTKKNKRLFLSYVQRKNIEVWTFDRDDVRLYGFLYHDQMHSYSLIRPNKISYQRAFFSGVDKGRLEVIKKIKRELELIPFSTEVHIVRDKNTNYLSSDMNITTDTYLDFNTYFSEVERSDVLIDVAQNGQQGITLRVVEALFQNKKLITTNVAVLSMEGYSPDNIYIYGYEENRTLKEFIETPTYIVKDSIKFKYTINHLLERMFG